MLLIWSSLDNLDAHSETVPVIIEHDDGFLQSRGDPFTALCRTIIGQQISVGNRIIEHAASKKEVINACL